MDVKIPEELKAEVPHTFWGRILSATPVVMAVVSTMLAGLSSSEMTRAQYSRSTAAQQQSKAGDQWSFFQAKRLRGALQATTRDLLHSTTEFTPLTGEALRAESSLTPALASPAAEQALTSLEKGEVPSVSPSPPLPQEVQSGLELLERGVMDTEMAPVLNKLDPKVLDQAVQAARDQAKRLDEATGPINKVIDQVDRTLSQKPSDPLIRSFTAARLRYAAARYETEARLNQAVANLYELQVRRSNLEAERHHARSQLFFFGMLAAQAAVIISTFAIAARKRNLLWSLAAGAGLVAILFATYVYLYV
jgi:hypothetical protein